MRLTNINQVNDFLETVNNSKGDVYLLSQEGDKFNLKSTLSQYLSIGALLGERGEYLELYCDLKEDESAFLKFFKEHPEVC